VLPRWATFDVLANVPYRLPCGPVACEVPGPPTIFLIFAEPFGATTLKTLDM
jgi:hypothetical protein